MIVRRLLTAGAATIVLWIAAQGAQAIEFRDFDAKSIATIRATQAGRPFVLAFWSIYCEPCRDELSQWGPLQRRYPNIQIILVATDPLANRAILTKILSAQHLSAVQTWAFADEFEERVRFAVDRSWRGELPRTYLFDSAHRMEVRSGPAELTWLEPWLARQASLNEQGLPKHAPAPRRQK